MTGILIRIAIFAAIAIAIYLGVRRIWRDWSGAFRAEDKARLERDKRERDLPGVVTLERGKDGKFRPPGSGET